MWTCVRVCNRVKRKPNEKCYGAVLAALTHSGMDTYKWPMRCSLLMEVGAERWHKTLLTSVCTTALETTNVQVYCEKVIGQFCFPSENTFVFS